MNLTQGRSVRLEQISISRLLASENQATSGHQFHSQPSKPLNVSQDPHLLLSTSCLHSSAEGTSPRPPWASSLKLDLASVIVSELKLPCYHLPQGCFQRDYEMKGEPALLPTLLKCPPRPRQPRGVRTAATIQTGPALCVTKCGPRPDPLTALTTAVMPSKVSCSAGFRCSKCLFIELFLCF